MKDRMNERIVYLSWPATEISGGIKLAFRHVEVLRQAGMEAVIATPGGEPPAWFDTDAPVIDVSAVVREKDVLVFPENHEGLLSFFANWPNRKLVFCQNHFMIHRGLSGRPDYSSYGISGIICEGVHVAEFCRRRFPGQPISLVPVVIDRELFCFQSQKKLQIAFAPSKRPLEAAFIQDLFRADNPEFRSIPWVEISDMTERDVARTLKETAVYLSLCRFEAIPMTPLEALASGCVVAGFTGFGGREYTTAKNGFWAIEDDCIDCTNRLTAAVRLVVGGGSEYRDLLEAANLSAGYYNHKRFANRITEFWRHYLGEGSFP